MKQDSVDPRPEEFGDVEAVLHRLGASERACFGPEAAARIAGAASAAARRDGLQLVGAARAEVTTRPAPFRSAPWRMAAAVALLGTAVAVGWWTTRPAAPRSVADGGEVSVEVAAYFAEEPASAADDALLALQNELAAIEESLFAQWSLEEAVWLEDAL